MKFCGKFRKFCTMLLLILHSTFHRFCAHAVFDSELVTNNSPASNNHQKLCSKLTELLFALNDKYIHNMLFVSFTKNEI